MKTNNKNLLLITAHPDDHICCAGTLLSYKERGFSITEVIATKGGLGAICDPETGNSLLKSDSEKTNIRKDELSEAQRILGIEQIIALGLEDGNIQRTSETIFKLIEIIRKTKPDAVLIHHTDDYHPDHINLSHISQEALQKAAWPMRPDLGESYRVPQSYMFGGLYIIKADKLVSVSQYKSEINKIIDVYSSQIYPAERTLLESIKQYYGFHLRASRKDSLWAEGLSSIPDFPNTHP